MKAVIFKRYGPPEKSLQIEDIKKPTPRSNQVLIKICATTVTSGVAIIRKGEFFVRLINGPFKPLLWKILGIEFSGIIEEVGNKVTKFKVGDSVFGSTGFSMGTFVEYKCLSDSKSISLKPVNLSFEEAAAIPVGVCSALYFLRDKGSIKQGQKVLIYGASGSVGTYAVQLAKYYGTNVTAICSTSNLELIKSIGADKVLDYTDPESFNELETYDLIFDAVGKTSKDAMKNHLNIEGKFVTVNKGLAREKPEILEFLKNLIEDGHLKPVIDKVYEFGEIAEAFNHVDQGHKKGNVVIRVEKV